MENAKKALQSFLKQLPSNSYFNVISYGSEFQYMYSESQAYNMIDDAIGNVNSFDADLGGTEIL